MGCRWQGKGGRVTASQYRTATVVFGYLVIVGAVATQSSAAVQFSLLPGSCLNQAIAVLDARHVVKVAEMSDAVALAFGFVVLLAAMLQFVWWPIAVAYVSSGGNAVSQRRRCDTLLRIDVLSHVGLIGLAAFANQLAAPAAGPLGDGFSVIVVILARTLCWSLLYRSVEGGKAAGQELSATLE